MRKKSTHPARRALALATAAALIAAGCGRDEDGSEVDEEATEDTSGDETGGDSGSGGSDSGLGAGEFGDLGTVCQDGDASGETDVGVTDDEIVVGTVTDKGSEVRAGLTQEMYDTAEAFVAWCNEHGGINGRELVLRDLDARLDQYSERIVEACEDTFSLVGGGAVFDDADDGFREECGLSNVAGYVVTNEARVAGNQVQPLPNPVTEFVAHPYRRIREMDPSIERFGMIWVNFSGPATIAEQVRETVEGEGYELAYDQEAAPMGETGWTNFVRDMRDADVQVVEYVGEPEDMARLLDAMQVEGWYPEYLLGQANMFDQLLIEQAGESLGEGGVLTRSAFPPQEVEDEAPAFSDYTELMEEYNPDGKFPALLGLQGLSSWLLFAQAATECGDDLTRECMLDNAHAVDSWTAGGLHGESDPGNLSAGACGLFIRVTADGFRYEEELTNPTDGLYNCEEGNVRALTGDYGVEPPER